MGTMTDNEMKLARLGTFALTRSTLPQGAPKKGPVQPDRVLTQKEQVESR